MSLPPQQYLPRPQLTPYVNDYEEVINGLTFYTRVHQAEYTITHYTAYVKPGELLRSKTFNGTTCAVWLRRF